MKKRFMLTAAGVAVTGFGATVSADTVSWTHEMDRWPAEHTWQCMDASGNIVASMYVSNSSLQYAGSITSLSYVSNTASSISGTVTFNMDMAGGDYHVDMQDSYGDGWAWGSFVGGLYVSGAASGGASLPSGSAASFDFTVTHGDCNENGIPDDEDIANGASYDCDQNDVPDECQPDCDGDGVIDPCDNELDCNENGIPDNCESDCNENGIPDDEDIANGASYDCDQNGAPDECQCDCDGDGFIDPCDNEPDCDDDGLPDNCESDCNLNGIPDDCDIIFGISEDCNENGIPDDCESPFNDCNLNGIPDECDIADGTSADADNDGIPDECQSGPGLWIVDDDFKEAPNADFNCIQDAVDAAEGGDEILVMPGTYSQPGSGGAIDGSLISIDCKPLWIHSSDGPEVTVIDGAGYYRCIKGTCDGFIEGFTIYGGSTNNSEEEDGAGLHWEDGELLLQECIFDSNFCEGNSIPWGGGACCNNTTVYIVDCEFKNNVVNDSSIGGHGGGLMLMNCTASVSNTIFTNNSAKRRYNASGGALSAWLSTLSLANCTFSNNSSDCWGGGLSVAETSLVVEDCSFIQNSGELGGALYFQSEDSLDSQYTGTLTNCTFTENVVSESINGSEWGFQLGGAVLLNYGSDLVANNCIFTDNVSEQLYGYQCAGAAIACLTQAEFVGDDPRYFVGLDLSECSFSRNEVAYSQWSGTGGAIWHDREIEMPLIRNNQPLIRMQLDRPLVEKKRVPNFRGAGEEFGACCIENFTHCKNMTSQDCTNLFSGIWQGAGTSCEAGDCEFEAREVRVAYSDFYCNLPDHIYGPWVDEGNNSFLGTLMPGDITGDYEIDINDLIAILGYWGSQIPAGDLNGDGVVNTPDLLIVIGNWGAEVLCE